MKIHVARHGQPLLKEDEINPEIPTVDPVLTELGRF